MHLHKPSAETESTGGDGGKLALPDLNSSRCVSQGFSSEELSGRRQQCAENQRFWDEPTGGRWDLFVIRAETDPHQMDSSRSSQLWWLAMPVPPAYTITFTFSRPRCWVMLADVSPSAIGPSRSLQLRERRVELWHPPVGDLQPGDVSLPWDDQPTGKRAGGER